MLDVGVYLLCSVFEVWFVLVVLDDVVFGWIVNVLFVVV